MADVREQTERLLDEHPDIEDSLRELLDIDAEGRPWEFDDVPVDSGHFGEIVSRDIVDEHGDGYQLTDRAAVAAALDDSVPDPDSEADSDNGVLFSKTNLRGARILPTVDRRVAIALTGALSLVALFRLVSFPAVFRQGDIVLLFNDPYFYRYWVDRLARQATGPFDIGFLGSLPEGVAHGEPLFVTTLWWFTELLGGTQWASEIVTAFYPVVATVVSGVFVFLLAKTATDDPRVGVASVVMLAVTPTHANRTSLGFGDHHAFDYLWLSVTAVALLLVLGSDRNLRDLKLWGGIALLGIGVGAQTLAWEAGPLLLVPVGVVTVLAVLLDVGDGQSPAQSGVPASAGIAFGAAVTLVAHTELGWHTRVVAFSPILLLGGVVGVSLLGMIVHRTGASVRVFLGLLAMGSVGVGVVVMRLLPELVPRLATQFDRLTATRNITETQSLIGGQSGWFVGTVIAFGPVLVLGIAYLLWASWRAYQDVDRRWLLLGVYTWYFLTLSLVEVRFAGELALFGAVFAGLGFVHVAAWIDIARPPELFTDRDSDISNLNRQTNGGTDESVAPEGVSFRWPDRREVALLVSLWLFVSSIGLIITPLFVMDGSYSAAQYEAADRARSYSAAHNLSYPDNYALSRWDDNRMYNYFVNGESKSYAYARRMYDRFGVGADAEQWYEKLKGRVGFVVIGPRHNDSNPLHQQLLNNYGSRGENNRSGLSHYRVLWTSDSKAYTLVRLVPGATITGNGPPASELTVSTQVDVGNRTVVYERRVRTNANGNFSITVPYPGRYSVGDGTVRVPERAVENGSTVSVTTNVSTTLTRPESAIRAPDQSVIARHEGSRGRNGR